MDALIGHLGQPFQVRLPRSLPPRWPCGRRSCSQPTRAFCRSKARCRKSRSARAMARQSFVKSWPVIGSATSRVDATSAAAAERRTCRIRSAPAAGYAAALPLTSSGATRQDADLTFRRALYGIQKDPPRSVQRRCIFGNSVRTGEQRAQGPSAPAPSRPHLRFTSVRSFSFALACTALQRIHYPHQTAKERTTERAGKGKRKRGSVHHQRAVSLHGGLPPLSFSVGLKGASFGEGVGEDVAGGGFACTRSTCSFPPRWAMSTSASFARDSPAVNGRACEGC